MTGAEQLVAEGRAIADPRLRPRPLTMALALNQALLCLGLFTLMPVLPVLLAALQHGGAAYVGPDLFAYTASAGMGALAFTRWLQRLPYAATTTGGLLLSAIGFGLLPYAGRPVAILAALLLAGLGYSTHFVYSRVLIAELISGDAQRHGVFSILQIAVNAAAAAGPFIAVSLYVSGRGRGLLLFVSGCYVLAAVTVLIRIPRRLRPPPATTRWAVSRATVTAVRRDRRALRVVVTTTVGSFLYAQFYSAFATMVARQVGSHALRAVLLAIPAIAIVLAQAGVSRLVARALTRGAHPHTVLALGALVFGAAMLALGAGTSVTVDAFVGVAVFSLAEMLFTPTVNTAFATLPAASRLEAFNLRQLSWTLGEAAGSWCGGSVFLYCLDRGDWRAYWLVLGAAALAGTAALTVTAPRRSASLT